MEMYFLTVLEARSVRSGHWQSYIFLRILSGFPIFLLYLHTLSPPYRCVSKFPHLFRTLLILDYESERRSVVSDSLQFHGLYSSWNSPGQNTGVGSLSLLQGIFPTQGLNPCLPHCRQILSQLSQMTSF